MPALGVRRPSLLASMNPGMPPRIWSASLITSSQSRGSMRKLLASALASAPALTVPSLTVRPSEIATYLLDITKTSFSSMSPASPSASTRDMLNLELLGFVLSSFSWSKNPQAFISPLNRMERHLAYFAEENATLQISQNEREDDGVRGLR